MRDSCESKNKENHMKYSNSTKHDRSKERLLEMEEYRAELHEHLTKLKKHKHHRGEIESEVKIEHSPSGLEEGEIIEIHGSSSEESEGVEEEEEEKEKRSAEKNVKKHKYEVEQRYKYKSESSASSSEEGSEDDSEEESSEEEEVEKKMEIVKRSQKRKDIPESDSENELYHRKKRNGSSKENDNGFQERKRSGHKNKEDDERVRHIKKEREWENARIKTEVEETRRLDWDRQGKREDKRRSNEMRENDRRQDQREEGGRKKDRRPIKEDKKREDGRWREEERRKEDRDNRRREERRREQPYNERREDGRRRGDERKREAMEHEINNERREDSRRRDTREESRRDERRREQREGGREDSRTRRRDGEVKTEPDRSQGRGVRSNSTEAGSSMNNRRPDRRKHPGSQERDVHEWGGSTANIKTEEKPGEKQKPNFELSGKLAEDTNMYNGVLIKYSEPPEARKPKKRWRLYPFKGDEGLPTLYIHRQSAYLMGRDRKVVDIPIDHPSCSKQHAALQYRLVTYERLNGSTGKQIRLYLIDLESANGTFINNKKIESKKYVELIEKDVIKFGFSSREYVLLHEHSKDDPLSDEDDD